MTFFISVHVPPQRPWTASPSSPWQAGCNIANMNTQERIREKLLSTFTPVHLDVVDESAGHRSGPGAQTHFRVLLVTTEFSGKPLLARHRAVNAELRDELAAGVHALALNTYTPDEWQARGGQIRQSPPCAGAS